MRIVAGILLLIIGVVFPLIMLIRLNSVLNRKPAPRPAHVGMMLALNGVLPLAMVVSGLILMSHRFAVSTTLQIVMLATWLASIVLVIALVISARAGRREKNIDGG